MNHSNFKLTAIFKGILFILFAASLCSAQEVLQEPLKTNDLKEELITINVNNVPIADVLRMLSAKKRINIVAGKEVSGNISLNLYNVKFDDVLKSVLNINGYTYTKKEDIIYVKGVEKKDEFPLETLNIETQLFRINHTNAEQLNSIVEKMCSNFGKTILSKGENTLIVEDMPEYLGRIEKIIKSLDVPPYQVMIEAKILEATLDDDLSFGIDWTILNNTNLGRTTSTFALTGFAKAASGFAYILDKQRLDIVLKMLQEKSNLKTLAAPKILALNNKKSEIIIGSRLGFRVTTTINAVTTESIEFLDVGTKLIITPHIADDGFVTMEIHPEVSDGEVVLGLPSARTTETTTNLIVKDGQTIVIGGLIKERQEKNISQIPILGDIPLLGYLFRSNSIKKTKSEIIVIITPHIVKDTSPEIMKADLEKNELFKVPSILDKELEKKKESKK